MSGASGFDATGEELCCAAFVRLDGALRVLAARAGLSDRYDVVAEGMQHLMASLGGQELDGKVLGAAFGENWGLDARYAPELPGADFFREGSRLVFIALVAARPDRQLTPEQGVGKAVDAAAAWPSDVRIGSFTRLVDFELACQKEAAERLRSAGLPALRELAEARAEEYRRVAEALPPLTGGHAGALPS
ncbi:hypothetical protein G9272_33965 [Streptomyces asoensis]|uniref:Uncharacterized protein n=1 Tax=Streptomyces asoensis TaxID=249586 RepID=A0A6M4WXQ2_9ACTN|nr:hypothetical protein [Streptomyces asoensis]QJT04692.1 hypothetical protein G9272_33965 [Streptomyces asoensis]